MIKLFESYLPQGWESNEDFLKIYQHSLCVANAAKVIATNTNILDPNKSFLCGIMHDVGKFFLDKKEKYKHPAFGYELLKEKAPEIANICISHPFPNFDLLAYFKHYCKGNKDEALKIKNILEHISSDIYIELIQLCDKLSGIDKYLSIESKFSWYKENYEIDEYCFNENFQKLMEIKNKFDRLTKNNIYSIVNISNS